MINLYIPVVRAELHVHESGTFQDSAARLFNILPDKLRHETDYDKFVRLVKNYLKQRAYDC